VTPDIERLSDRLARTPQVFRVSPGMADAPNLHAVLADLFRDRARAPLTAPQARFVPDGEVPGRNGHLALVSIAAWLLHDEAFQGADGGALESLLLERLEALSRCVVARKFVEDDARREELVRVCLDALGILPADETHAFAADRLAALDSVERQALLRRAKDAEKARDAERARRQAELAKLRAEEEAARREAARLTHED